MFIVVKNCCLAPLLLQPGSLQSRIRRNGIRVFHDVMVVRVRHRSVSASSATCIHTKIYEPPLLRRYDTPPVLFHEDTTEISSLFYDSPRSRNVPPFCNPNSDKSTIRQWIAFDFQILLNFLNISLENGIDLLCLVISTVLQHVLTCVVWSSWYSYVVQRSVMAECLIYESL